MASDSWQVAMAEHCKEDQALGDLLRRQNITVHELTAVVTV